MSQSGWKTEVIAKAAVQTTRSSSVAEGDSADCPLESKWTEGLALKLSREKFNLNVLYVVYILLDLDDVA